MRTKLSLHLFEEPLPSKQPPPFFQWSERCSWMFRWENEQAASLFIPSHTAVIILSAMIIRQLRRQHNKSHGRGALRAFTLPVILHLKWSCKKSQAAVQRTVSAEAEIWWSSTISRCWLLFAMGQADVFLNLFDYWKTFLEKEEKLHTNTSLTHCMDTLHHFPFLYKNMGAWKNWWKCLRVIKICRYSCSQHTSHQRLITPITRYLVWQTCAWNRIWSKLNSSDCRRY